MSTWKEHLVKMAAHSITAAKYHKTRMDGEEADDGAMMQSHTELADHCLKMAKAMEPDFEKTQVTAKQAIENAERVIAEAVAVGAIDERFVKLIALDERDEVL